jgi:MYXO-CTERM domain-containing protein
MIARRVAVAFVASIATTAAFVAFGGGVARANSRFPEANQLVIDPGNATHMAIRTSYGLLQTFDDGASWQWLCEKSIGYGGTYDPAIAVTDKGSLLTGLLDGLSRSGNRGCDFAHQPGVLDKQDVIDISVLKSDPSKAVAITSTGGEAGAFYVIVAESSDDGVTWTQQGTQIPSDFTGETIDVAPSDPKRIYVSGFYGTPHVSAMEVSSDGGATWQRYDIGVPTPRTSAPYIAAIDPTDEDRVYARLDVDGPGDVFVVSKDGGKTWTAAYTAKEDLLGLAISPDGSRIALGGTRDGVKVAGKDDLTFVQTSDVTTWCLTWGTEGLFVCASEFPDCFTVGRSTDEGKTWTPLYHLSDLTQLSCPASSTTGTQCPSQWDDPVNNNGVVQILGIGSEPVPCTPGSPDAADGGADGGGTEPGSPASSSSSGCGCAVVGASTSSAAELLVALAAIARAVRRRNQSS